MLDNWNQCSRVSDLRHRSNRIEEVRFSGVPEETFTATIICVRLSALCKALHKADYAKLAIMQSQKSQYDPTAGRVQTTNFAYFA